MKIAGMPNRAVRALCWSVLILMIVYALASMTRTFDEGPLGALRPLLDAAAAIWAAAAVLGLSFMRG